MKKTYFEYEDGDEYVIPSVKVQEGPEEFGCGFCWDKRKKQTKELYFLDAANNMRVCTFCPSCGRELKED